MPTTLAPPAPNSAFDTSLSELPLVEGSTVVAGTRTHAQFIKRVPIYAANSDIVEGYMGLYECEGGVGFHVYKGKIVHVDPRMVDVLGKQDVAKTLEADPVLLANYHLILQPEKGLDDAAYQSESARFRSGFEEKLKTLPGYQSEQDLDKTLLLEALHAKYMTQRAIDSHGGPDREALLERHARDVQSDIAIFIENHFDPSQPSQKPPPPEKLMAVKNHFEHIFELLRRADFAQAALLVENSKRDIDLGENKSDAAAKAKDALIRSLDLFSKDADNYHTLQQAMITLDDDVLPALKKSSNAAFEAATQASQTLKESGDVAKSIPPLIRARGELKEPEPLGKLDALLAKLRPLDSSLPVFDLDTPKAPPAFQLPKNTPSIPSR